MSRRTSWSGGTNLLRSRIVKMNSALTPPVFHPDAEVPPDAPATRGGHPGCARGNLCARSARMRGGDRGGGYVRPRPDLGEDGRAAPRRRPSCRRRAPRALRVWPAAQYLDMGPAMRILGDHPEWFAADLFHPDARGHELLAQHAWPVVARAVAAVESRRSPVLTLGTLADGLVGADPGFAGDVGLVVS